MAEEFSPAATPELAVWTLALPETWNPPVMRCFSLICHSTLIAVGTAGTARRGRCGSVLTDGVRRLPVS
ncbi:hypothetical protein [Kitasatospora sp. NPDC001175]|uniref:hypothetical protein n=1 Tax=Kitasatospora sp. NPDC001175 TaxID=3157103 RepID=UPI003CFCC14F